MSTITKVSEENAISRSVFNTHHTLFDCDEEKLFALRMPDDSMSGTIECGDVLLASKFCIGDNLWDGIYLYEINGFRQCRRIQVAGEQILILSDSNTYQTIRLTKKEVMTNGLRILGMIRYHCQVKRIG